MKGIKNKVWNMSDENKVIFDRDFCYEHLNDGDAPQCDGEHYIEYQRAEYIEDGEYIRVYSNRFELWSIPQYGGEEGILHKADTINEIINYYKTL